MPLRAPRRIPAGALIAVIVLLPLLALVGAVVWVHSANNAAAQQLESRVQLLPVPPGAEVIDSGWAAQRLSATGNGMQHSGALLIRSHLGLADLEADYADIDPDAQVIATGGPRTERSTLIFSDLHDLDQPDLFMVLLRDEPPGDSILQLDLRGH